MAKHTREIDLLKLKDLCLRLPEKQVIATIRMATYTTHNIK